MFDLNGESLIYIYGAGALGKKVYGQIREKCSMGGFFDREIKELPYDDIKCYSLENYHIEKGASVLVCVHNGLWHKEIADNLKNAGCNRILFIPMGEGYDPELAHQMNKKYADLLFGTFPINDIPEYDCMLVEKKSKLLDPIEESIDWVTCYCPVDMLYTGEPTNGYSDHIIEKLSDKILGKSLLYYMDTPIAAFKPYIELYRYFVFREKYPQEYVTLFNGVNNSFMLEEEDFLRERFQVFTFFKTEIERQGSFKDMPAEVWLHDNGKFSVLDGTHRTVFQYVMGITNIPVRMRRQNYYALERMREAVYDVCNDAVEIFTIITAYMCTEKIRYSTFVDFTDTRGRVARCLLTSNLAVKCVVACSREDADEIYRRNEMLGFNDGQIIVVTEDDWAKVSIYDVQHSGGIIWENSVIANNAVHKRIVLNEIIYISAMVRSKMKIGRADYYLGKCIGSFIDGGKKYNLAIMRCSDK